MSPFLTAWNPFNERIEGIHVYETFRATTTIYDFRDGEPVVIREL